MKNQNLSSKVKKQSQENYKKICKDILRKIEWDFSNVKEKQNVLK